MHALVLLSIRQHTKFYVPSIADSKDIMGAKVKNWPRDHDYAH